MGMYDIINGEQVKCFPLAYYYKTDIFENSVHYSCGNLEGYNNGDFVPYKKFYYNYGKNFIILDTHVDYSDGLEYILHSIRDGKVFNTFIDTTDGLIFDDNTKVIDYYGNFINIKSVKEIEEYVSSTKKYKEAYEELNRNKNKLLREWSKLGFGLGTLSKDSEEFKLRTKKQKEINQKINEEENKIKEQNENLQNNYQNKWSVDTSSINDLISFGEYLYLFERDKNKETELVDIYLNLLRNLKTDDLIKRFKDWYCETEEEEKYLNDILSEI